MRSTVALSALLAVLAAGCGSRGDTSSGGGAPTTTPAPTTASVPLTISASPVPPTTAPETAAPPSTPPPTSPLSPPWTVGASPLPLREDGFGQVLPTPPELRDRRLQAADVLPAPADQRFRSSINPITPAIRARMGDSHREGCPVALADLRYLTLGYRGFDGLVHTGEMIVAAEAAEKVVAAFRSLYALGFPIEEMRIITTADLDAPATGDGSNTAAYICRAARGQTRFSAHAFGLAVDVNPFHNPYEKGDLVLPELASAYLDRGDVRPGMLLRGSPEVQAFTSQGFTWGGDFRSLKDYQHFSLTGS